VPARDGESGESDDENKHVGSATLKIMGDYGKSKKVMVAMENRGSGVPRGRCATSRGRARASATATGVEPARRHHQRLRHVRQLRSRQLSRSGNAARRHPRLFPMTDGNCHVKLNPARYDLPAALALVKSLNYQGLYSIEAGGQGDPHENVQRIYDVLLPNM
jgi:hypothetical protein